MNELTDKNFVIVTRNSGRYYVTKSQAYSLISMVNSKSPQKVIQIGNDISFTTQDFLSALPAWKVDEIDKEKSGKWKCQMGNWHDRFDKCKCSWGMDTNSTVSKFEDNPLTEDQKKRGNIMKRLVDSRGYKMSEMMYLRLKTTEELSKLLNDKIE